MSAERNRDLKNPTMRVRGTVQGPLEPPDDPLGPARGCFISVLMSAAMVVIIALILLYAIHHH